MEQVVQTFKRTDGEKRIAVLRLEIDYELATLHDALVARDYKKIAECKKKLEKFRLELIRLEV
ncbi:hypothetical protein DS745_17585 [Anaerobacillus alkaliphilus]|uniref:Uncharacterized protein n=1 Tax=Anaerobacillus alkaliphilus TaxID=1548597 RepID=A0A4V1LG12_9BACI|nr:hypothetical protein [Anaerobacillus alkaliphilus]RXI98154.1 hypothetical protein DS745_17585 [Anaerobacillus alkaliphilus]